MPGVDAFDVVCYDQRGLGQSDRPAGPSTMADFADDAAAVIDWAGWDRVALIGVSFGGMVAQELLLRHPDRIERAVLACTSSGGDGGASFPLHELSELAPDERARRMLALLDTRWADPANLDPIGRATLARLQSSPPADVGAVAQLEARRHHDTWARLAEVACPVLVAAGRFDGIAALANSERLAERIPGASLAVFDGGHLFLLQVPGAAPAVLEFLSVRR